MIEFMQTSFYDYPAYDFNCGPGTVYSKETENCVHPRDSNRPDCASISENMIEGGGDGMFMFIRISYAKCCTVFSINQ